MSSTGGSTWNKMTEMEDGWCLAKGSLYLGGDLNHDNNGNTPDVMAVFRSSDQGTTWSQFILNDLEGAVYDIAVHPIHTNIVFAGGGVYSSSLGKYVPHLLKTSNGGTEWTEITPSDWNTHSNMIRCLAVDPSDSQRVWAGLYDGVYMSSDGGNNWYHVKTIDYVNCMILDPIHPKFVIIGTMFNGILYTDNRGSTWHELGTDFPENQDVFCMDLDLSNRYVYVGTESGGVYRYSLGTTGVFDSEDFTLPVNAALLPNYPNPFNAFTKITFELKNPCPTELWISDVRGRQVRTLLSGVQAAGINETSWDGKDNQGLDVSSGIYILRLQAGDNVKSLKMVLQR